MRQLLVCVSLAACLGPRDTDKPDDDDDGGGQGDNSATCAYDTDTWRESLPWVVAQTDGSGNIDYEPTDVQRDRRTGTYDDATGEFSLDTTYADGHKYVSSHEEGTYTANGGGDFEASYTTAYLDVFDVERNWERHYLRSGCTSTAELAFQGDSGAFPGTYTWYSTIESNDRIAQELETTYDGDPWVEQRVSTSDLQTTYTIDLDDGRYTAAGTYFADGTHERTSTDITDDRRYESAYLWAMHGGHETDREGYDLDDELVMTFVATYAYDGSATGIYTYWDDDGTEVTCDYVRDSTLEDDCTYTYICDNGDESGGDC